MPRFDSFDGVSIRLHFAEHPPPHFHAAYQGRVYRFAIETGEQLALDRHIAPVALSRRLRRWAKENQGALMAAWAKWEELRGPEQE